MEVKQGWREGDTKEQNSSPDALRVLGSCWCVRITLQAGHNAQRDKGKDPASARPPPHAPASILCNHKL